MSVKGVDLEKLDDHSEKKVAECIERVKKEVNSGEAVQKPKPKFLRMKWLIPIVALFAMLTIGVVAQTLGFDVIDMTKKATIVLL